MQTIQRLSRLLSAVLTGEVTLMQQKMQCSGKRSGCTSVVCHFFTPPSFPQLNLLVTNVTHTGKYATCCHCGFKQNRIVASLHCCCQLCSSLSFISINTLRRGVINLLYFRMNYISLARFSKSHLKRDFARCSM